MATTLNNERGLVLVAALMLLVLMTLMGLAAVSTTITEVQLTANERTDAQAFHSAEAGIKEILYRQTLVQAGTNSIANNGSYATVDAVTFDAAIRDPGVAVGTETWPDKDWKYNVYYSMSDPADAGSVKNSRTILPSNKWTQVNYASTTEAVTVSYVTEMDLLKWGIADPDLNNDGDTVDLVFYNAPTGQRVGSRNQTLNVVDNAPPLGSSIELAVRKTESIGRSGNAQKRIILESTHFAANPQVQSALQVDIPITVTGNGFISGFNHSENTVKTDNGSLNPNLYKNNGCDNASQGNQGANTGKCVPAFAGAGDPDNNLTAEYSGKTVSTGHKPAVVTKDTVTTQGSFEGWGGNDDNTKGWVHTDPTIVFPTLEALLGVDAATVQQLKNNANTNPSACPTGVTYIDNKGTGQDYRPSQNCPAGSGILIVTGDMKTTSQFEFRGLVYVEGDADLRGGTFFLGAMAVKGVAATNKTNAGSSTILYSKKTVENAVSAAFSSVGLAFNLLSWRED